jgi:hypothetical protein
MRTKRKLRAVAVSHSPEPIIRLIGSSTDSQLASCYTWYNQHHRDRKEALGWVVSYLKSVGRADDARLLQRLDPKWIDMSTCVNCKIIGYGGILPDDIIQRTHEKITKALSHPSLLEKQATPKVVVDIQGRVREATSELIGFFNGVVDEGKPFDTYQYLSQNQVKPLLARAVAHKFRSHLEELEELKANQPPDLVEAYRHLTKAGLNTLMDLVRSIVKGADRYAGITKAINRKPRKRKVKPPLQVVKGLKYAARDEELNLVSVEPASIVGALSCWLYHVPTRRLTRYVATNGEGLTVKGSTIIRWDPETSESRRLRKPSVTLPVVLSTGTRGLEKLLSSLTTKPQAPSGRVNSDTIILRTVR